MEPQKFPDSRNNPDKKKVQYWSDNLSSSQDVLQSPSKKSNMVQSQQYKSRHLDQWNKIEDPNMSTHISVIYISER